MKKWLLGMLSLLVACNGESDIISTAEMAGDAISFGIVPDWQTTRADTHDMNLASLKESGFGVFAYNNKTGSFFMTRTPVTFDGTAWTYSPKQYWPSATANFYAYAPFGGAGIEAGTAGGEATVRYTISDTTAPTDLLWGVSPNDGLPFTAVTRDAGRGGIDFQFKHAMARITLSIRAASTLSFSEGTAVQTTALMQFFSDQYSSYIESINDVSEAKALLQEAEATLKDVQYGTALNLGIILARRIDITSANIEQYWDMTYGMNALGTFTYVKDNIKAAMKDNETLRAFWVNKKVTEYLENHSSSVLHTTQKVLLTGITLSGLYTATTLNLNNTTPGTPLWTSPSGNASFTGFTIPVSAAYSTDNRDNIADPAVGITTTATLCPDSYLVIPSDHVRLTIAYRIVTSAPTAVSGTIDNPAVTTSITVSDERTYTRILPALSGSKEYAIGLTIE